MKRADSFDDRPAAQLERLRSGQACAGCRKGKNRCDGARPRCNYCIRRNIQCDYPTAPRKSRVSPGYVNSLEEKIRRLESRIAAGQTARLEASGTGSPDDDFPLSPSSDKETFDNQQPVEVIEFGAISLLAAVSDLGSIPTTDGLNKRPSVPSPSRSFPRSPSVANSAITTGGVVRSSDELPENDFHLPERSIAEMLTDIFFKRVYAFFPYVDEATFREQLSAAYNEYERSGKTINRERDHVPWLSLMNLVFAFACDYVDLPVGKIQSLAKIFASRANDLIISVCFEIGTLEVLQALLLLSVHLLSSMQLNKCWASVGSLVRTGQGLGLHLDPSNWKISELEKDMRKRLWWGLFCLDRFTSAKQGRPPAIMSHTVPVANPTNSGLTSRHSETDLWLFRCTVELARIQETITVSTFNTPGTRTGPGIQELGVLVGVAVEHERLMSIWKHALPEYLRFEDLDLNRPGDGQKLTLYSRYLHTQLLLHRQVFVALTRRKNPVDFKEDSFLHAVVGASVRQCVECSEKLIDVLDTTFESKSIGAWWYNITFLFTAMGTLYAAILQPCFSSYIDVSSDEIRTRLLKGLTMIEKVADMNEITQQCKEYFKSLQQAIDQFPKKTDAPMQHADIFQPLLANMEATLIPEPSFEAQLFDTHQQINHIGADVFSGDWNAIYGAADIFKDPLLPEFGLNWLDS